MFRNFLDTQDDYMLIADSDLIFRSDIIKVIKTRLYLTYFRACIVGLEVYY